MLLIIDRAGYDPHANLAYEEALFRSLRASPRPTALFYVNDPCVVLGRGNAEEQWVDAAACAAAGIPVLRRFSGGGTVYHDRDNLNFSFCVPRALLDASAHTGPAIQRYIGFFRRVVIRALEQGGGGYAESGVSDICLNGLKVSGNAQRIAGELVLHHGTLLLRCDVAAIERYLPVPPNRPGVPHRGFVTGLHDAGRLHSPAELKAWLAQSFAAALDEL